MFFSVKELELRKIRFDTGFSPGQIEFLDAALKQSAPFQVSGTAELVTGGEEVRVRGHLTGTVASDCDRCLEPLQVPMDGDFDLYYRPAESEFDDGEVELSPAEAEVGFYENGGVELADVVREQILLWLPMQRLCRQDCKGICPTCGQNRNTTECSCRVERIDERWRALSNL